MRDSRVALSACRRHCCCSTVQCNVCANVCTSFKCADWHMVMYVSWSIIRPWNSNIKLDILTHRTEHVGVWALAIYVYRYIYLSIGGAGVVFEWALRLHTTDIQCVRCMFFFFLLFIHGHKHAGKIVPFRLSTDVAIHYYTHDTQKRWILIRVTHVWNIHGVNFVHQQDGYETVLDIYFIAMAFVVISYTSNASISISIPLFLSLSISLYLLLLLPSLFFNIVVSCVFFFFHLYTSLCSLCTLKTLDYIRFRCTVYTIPLLFSFFHAEKLIVHLFSSIVQNDIERIVL